MKKTNKQPLVNANRNSSLSFCPSPIEESDFFRKMKKRSLLDYKERFTEKLKCDLLIPVVGVEPTLPKEHDFESESSLFLLVNYRLNK